MQRAGCSFPARTLRASRRSQRLKLFAVSNNRYWRGAKRGKACPYSFCVLVASAGDSIYELYSNKNYALHAPISLECHSWASSDTVAQSLSAVAHRDLLRCQNAADRVHRILGIYVARTPESLAFFEMDWRDGALRPSRRKERVEAGSCGAASHHPSRRSLPRQHPRLPGSRPSLSLPPKSGPQPRD